MCRLFLSVRWPLVLVVALFHSLSFSQSVKLPDSPWHFLDTKTTGAYDFLKKHPTYDGRGVVLVICDTGVDMGIPGLLKTSEGKVKVIDAQDFSGQGDIRLSKGELDSTDKEVALESGSVRLTGFEALVHRPEDGVYWMGAIDEAEHFQNSAIKDINNNGKEDDLFGFVTFPVTVDGEERWVYYLDEDGDGNLQDEVPRFDYKYGYDAFTLRGRDVKEEKSLLTMVLTVRPDEEKASLHACDNSHGTHCAGIAAGYQIFGEPTQHGIAPGAQVISCKIGDATLAGGSSTTGAMKRAYEYGVEWAKDHNVPVVFSMSYGIGSEIEGRSDIETFLNGIMEENENVVVVVSNGNSGPGLSSTGNPAGGSRILSAGAMLPFGSARDLYGFANDGDRVFHFNSRGGEVYKPDCLTPGCAASTVPAHASGETGWGTSMACPQLSGACAVLISACLQESIPFNGALIKRAVKYSATPLPDYTPLDQGTGVINIPRAFEILKMFAEREEHEQILDYEIETASPNYPDGKGTTAYWRAGGYFPPETEKQVFRVEAIFPEELTADQKQGFYRTYNLKTDRPWLKLDRSSTYIRADHSARIGVYYRHDLMKKPGLYVGKVTAYPKSGAGKDVPEFELLNTVIVPYTFDSGNGYTLEVKGQSLKSGRHHRYFVMVPPGASAMHVTIAPSPGKWCGVYGYVFDPEGARKGYLSRIDPEKKEPTTFTCTGEDLVPGVWEIVPFAYHNLTRKSTYDLEVRFDGFRVEPTPIAEFAYENGRKPGGTLRVVNQFRKFTGKAEGELKGYRKASTLRITDDVYRYTFRVDERTDRVRFELSLDEETWNRFTDLAVNIRDKKDRILHADGMGRRSLAFSFRPPEPGEYVLEIIGGFTLPSKKEEEWKVDFMETYYTTETIGIRVTQNEEETFTLYPGIPVALAFELEKIPRIVPDGFERWGEVEFKGRVEDRVVATVSAVFEK